MAGKGIARIDEPKSPVLITQSEDGWEQPPMDKEKGTGFSYTDQLDWGFTNDAGKPQLVDYSDNMAQDINRMLFGKVPDYKAKQVELVLSLPILSAERDIKGIAGDSGEADWLQEFWARDEFDGGCRESLDEIIASMTTAFSFAKNFNELEWQPDPNGKRVILSKVAYRPATTCRLRRDPINGTEAGFEQQQYASSPKITSGIYPIIVKPKRSFVYIHGQRFDPINGTSDLQVAQWAYRTKQKIMFLWMQFMENTALPRTTVKAQDVEVAKEIAAQIARLRGSGVIPIGTNGQTDSVSVDVLDTSGKGADQFLTCMNWLDQAATTSVVAGFLDLTGAATNGIRGGGGGSYALSESASDYFLQFEESKCREIERAVRRKLFAPMIRYNFGKNCKVPQLKFEPLNTEDKAQQIAMLQAFAAAPPGGPVPSEFIAMLAQQVATYFGLDGQEVHDLFVKQGKLAAAQAAAASPAGAAPLGQGVAQVAGAVSAATNIANSHNADGTPKPALPPELQHIDFSKLNGAAA